MPKGFDATFFQAMVSVAILALVTMFFLLSAWPVGGVVFGALTFFRLITALAYAAFMSDRSPPE